MLELVNAGGNKTGQAFDLFTRHGKYAGMIVQDYAKGCKVYFDSNCSKGSARTFATVQAAADFIVTRRIKKGWTA
jgi:hypothetical protein